MLFLSEPSLWPAWPILPLVRRRPGSDDECGFLFDFEKVYGRAGFTSTVFLGNIFEMPASHEELLQLSREVYDGAEEVYAAGWRID
jgi:hypothetical protein